MLLFSKPAPKGGGGTTWNANDVFNDGTNNIVVLSNANLTGSTNVPTAAASSAGVRSTNPHATGKYYAEYVFTNQANGGLYFGIANPAFALNALIGANTNGIGARTVGAGIYAYFNNSYIGTVSASNTHADVLALAVDIGAQLSNANDAIINAFMPRFAAGDVSDQQVQDWYAANGFV